MSDAEQQVVAGATVARWRSGRRREGLEHQLGAVGCGPGGPGRVGGVAGGRGLADLPGADGLLGVEGPGDLFAAVGSHADGQDLVVDEGGEGEGAGGGGDGAGEFGVPQAQTPVDGGDGADRVEREVPDRQATGAPAAAELGPVVLDPAVLDGEADPVGPGLLVDHAAELAVAEERALVPEGRQPGPQQVLAAQEPLPGVVGGHGVAESPGASGALGHRGGVGQPPRLRGVFGVGRTGQGRHCRTAQRGTEYGSTGHR